jgi:hypothetical protein
MVRVFAFFFWLGSSDHNSSSVVHPFSLFLFLGAIDFFLSNSKRPSEILPEPKPSSLLEVGTRAALTFYLDLLLISLPLVAESCAEKSSSFAIKAVLEDVYLPILQYFCFLVAGFTRRLKFRISGKEPAVFFSDFSLILLPWLSSACGFAFSFSNTLTLP